MPDVKDRQRCNRKDWYSLQQKGSLTLESAAVLPLYFLAMVMLVSMIDIFRIQTILVSSLSQSAKELGMYAYSIDGESRSPVGAVTDAACIVYASAEVQKRGKEPHGNCGKTGRDYTAGVIIQGWHRNIESKLSVQKPCVALSGFSGEDRSCRRRTGLAGI